MKKIVEKFESLFGDAPEILAKAPGRINLIGEHTDYNKGYVLPAAIDRYMYFAFSKNNSNTTTIHALDISETVEFTVLVKQENKTWSNFFIGILIQLNKSGINISGFDLVFGGDIPLGGGLSSSSALECGFLKVLNTSFSLNLSHMEMIEISRKSNHEFLGLAGGIMDQFSVLYGRENNAILLNCDNLEFEYIPVNLDNTEILSVNSKVSHSLIHSAYNERVRECNEALKLIQNHHPNVIHLSMASKTQINSATTSMNETQVNRAEFIYKENERVHKFVEAIKSKSIEEAGQLLFKSHYGLRDKYEVSCKEIDILVQLAEENEHIHGARMMGGGFGGCTINLVKHENLQQVIQDISIRYKNDTGITPEFYQVKICEGASIIRS